MWPGRHRYAAPVNYLLAIFIGLMTLMAAHNKFGTQGLVILAGSLVIGLFCFYKMNDERSKETPGQVTIMAWLAYIFTVPAAVTLIGGLIEEFSGSR